MAREGSFRNTRIVNDGQPIWNRQQTVFFFAKLLRLTALPVFFSKLKKKMVLLKPQLSLMPRRDAYCTFKKYYGDIF